jgi:hypothetical protein
MYCGPRGAILEICTCCYICNGRARKNKFIIHKVNKVYRFFDAPKLAKLVHFSHHEWFA